MVDSDVTDDVSLSGPGEAWLTIGERVTFNGAISLDSGESLYITAADNKLHQNYREINVDGGKLYVEPSGGTFRIENSDSVTLSNGGQIILLPKDTGNATLQFRLVGVTPGDYDSGELPLDFTGGLVSNPGGTIYLGANSKVSSDNSMEAARISLMDAAVLQESARIVVDGKGQALTDASSGKAYYTYAHISMADGAPGGACASLR